MKSRQFCSVCKQWLDMEVVPTGDGDDDGVVWFRCPQCQGFLPKLSAAPAVEDAPAGATAADGGEAAGRADDDDVLVGVVDAADDEDADDDEAASRGDDRFPVGRDRNVRVPDDDETDQDDEPGDDDEPEDDDDEIVGRPPLPVGVPSEPIHEYAAMLADVDPEQAVPYRPWESYEVGQCILHLAWNDCGVVVAKEQLPGGRRVVKCWFQGAGVVRLIENAPR